MMTWPSTRLSGIPGLTHRESWGLFMAINGVNGRSIRWTSAGDSTPMGHRPEAHEAFQTPQKVRVSRFVETFEIVRRLCTEDNVSYRGKHYAFDDVSINPKPLQQPLPMWIGSFADPAIKRTARMADAWVISP